jgi:Transposase DDE domain group 1
MVDLWCESHRRPPKAITLDIDDTADTVYDHQQLSLFNAHYYERCFMPVHVCDADTGHCVLTILRPGETPDGKEVCGHLRRLVRRIRLHWPNTRVLWSARGHGLVQNRSPPFLPSLLVSQTRQAATSYWRPLSQKRFVDQKLGIAHASRVLFNTTSNRAKRILPGRP